MGRCSKEMAWHVKNSDHPRSAGNVHTPSLEFHQDHSMVSIALVFALLPLKNFLGLYDFQMEVPFTKQKWSCPLEDEVPVLSCLKMTNHCILTGWQFQYLHYETVFTHGHIHKFTSLKTIARKNNRKKLMAAVKSMKKML